MPNNRPQFGLVRDIVSMDQHNLTEQNGLSGNQTIHFFSVIDSILPFH